MARIPSVTYANKLKKYIIAKIFKYNGIDTTLIKYCESQQPQTKQGCQANTAADNTRTSNHYTHDATTQSDKNHI